MKPMNDESHIDRYVRITNRERYLILRALSLLEHSCEILGFAYDGMHISPELRELYKLSEVFCEENWIIGRNINTGKVKRIETPEEYQEGQDYD